MKELQSWNSLISKFTGAHILQSWEWGEVKSCFDWTPEHLVWVSDGQQVKMVLLNKTFEIPPDNVVAAMLLLSRTARLGGFDFKILYVPKGPLLDWENQSLRALVLNDLALYASEKGALFIKIDPDVKLGIGFGDQSAGSASSLGSQIENDLIALGWCFSPEQVQFQNTVCLDLSRTEDQILAAMKQKTRYNLRLAERKGVQVQIGSEADLPLLFEMYAETSLRDGFVIRDQEYYQTVWRKFLSAGLADVLIAYVADDPVAALILFSFCQKSWYLYGMSRQSHREKMPNYLLQWRAIQLAKSKGSLVYDLWGAPDVFDESDPLWGVYKFKEGLGGTVVRHIGAWDRPTKPLLYQSYHHLLPRVLDIMRRRGRSRTRRQIGL